MRIHTNHPLPDSVFTNARQAAGVMHEKYERHNSRTHATAREVLLEGESGRRSNGGRRGTGDFEAASWDQWGIYLGFIFDQDPTAKTPYYKDADDFNRATGGRFSLAEGNDIFDAKRVLSQYSPGYQKTSHRWQYDYEHSGWLSGEAIMRCVNGKHYSPDGQPCTAVMVRSVMVR